MRRARARPPLATLASPAALAAPAVLATALANALAEAEHVLEIHLTYLPLTLLLIVINDYYK
jgi:hypothetical protein